ncbi:MAG TPA: ribonuclease III [bacterium]|nr:ribonuclease III [bacterium]HPR86902.1 ribonuclease III [bacterium]
MQWLKDSLFRLFAPRQKARPPQLEELMVLINYRFHDQSLLIQSLKHRSYLAQTGEDRLKSNERLELLGDAVLGLVVTEILYADFPDEEEGVLTNYKSLLVNRVNLGRVAHEFDLGRFILLNDSEERAGGRSRDSILADAVEAVIGAMYLDGGLEPTRKLILKHIVTGLSALLEETQYKNFKSLLLEYCQRESKTGPIYMVENEEGPDHNKTFTVGVFINGSKFGSGVGSSKKAAEQHAAEEAFNLLQQKREKGQL